LTFEHLFGSFLPVFCDFQPDFNQIFKPDFNQIFKPDLTVYDYKSCVQLSTRQSNQILPESRDPLPKDPQHEHPHHTTNTPKHLHEQPQP
jgi:hypothetical protein